MFGKNEVVGKKFFDNAGEKLFITSMFYTLQGEGPLRGKPAFFIRFAKCNLACSFCDTYFDNGDWMTIAEIGEKINEILWLYYNGTPKWASYSEFHKRQMALVITGGEPTLQKNILPFLTAMQDQFEEIQIETNGILFTEVPLSTIVVCSPKCVEKDGKAIRYMAPNAKVLNRADCLKFVMEADPESPYSTIPEWAFTWRETTNKEIYVSPMNIYNSEPQAAIEARRFKNELSLDERSDVNEKISFWTPGLIDLEKVQKNHEYTAKFCIEHGCTFNMQLHLFAGLA
jgi:organic radical activating enzyme